MTHHYPPIVPYLAVGDAAAAIAFYQAAFGAEEKLRVPGEGGRNVMHAEITINGGMIMLTDAVPEHNFPGPSPDAPVPVGLMLAWPLPDDVDRIFAKAVSLGAKAETQPREEPWGARFAAVTDPWGQRWWLHAPLTRPAGPPVT